MEKKRICHITNEHPRYDTRIFLKMCRTLAESGYEVTLLCADDLPEEKVSGVHLIPAARKPVSRRERATKTVKALYKKALEIDADVYQLHDPELIPLCRKLKKKGYRVIFDSHEDFPAQIMDKSWIPRWVRQIVSIAYTYLEKQVAKKLDYVFSVTEPITERFAGYGVKTETIHNYPLLTEFRFLEIVKTEYSDKGKKDQEGRKTPPVLCFTGNISITRGMRQMFKVMETVDAQLVLAGKIFVNEDAEFEQLLSKHLNVEFRGPYTREEMIEIYRESDAALLLFLPIQNHLQSLPNKLFEYMAGGLPVIASNIDFWKPIFEKHQCGIQVDPTDSKSVTDAVTYILSNPREARHMGEKGRRAVEEEYNWERESRKLLAVYQHLTHTI